jgi:hypothetical protein
MVFLMAYLFTKHTINYERINTFSGPFFKNLAGAKNLGGLKKVLTI